MGEGGGAGSLSAESSALASLPPTCLPQARGHLLLQPWGGSWAAFSRGPEEGANLGVTFDLTTILRPGESTHSHTHTHTDCVLAKPRSDFQV